MDSQGQLLIQPVRETVTLRGESGATPSQTLQLKAGAAAHTVTTGRALELRLNLSMPAAGECTHQQSVVRTSTEPLLFPLNRKCGCDGRPGLAQHNGAHNNPARRIYEAAERYHCKLFPRSCGWPGSVQNTTPRGHCNGGGSVGGSQRGRGLHQFADRTDCKGIPDGGRQRRRTVVVHRGGCVRQRCQLASCCAMRPHLASGGAVECIFYHYSDVSFVRVSHCRAKIAAFATRSRPCHWAYFAMT